MNRRVEPELLDELPPDDPSAVRSRRDLRRLNFLMRHATIVARALLESDTKPPRRVVELGAGDGTFLLAVAGKLARRWPNIEAVLLDRQNIVTGKTHAGFANWAGPPGWRSPTCLRLAGAVSRRIVRLRDRELCSSPFFCRSTAQSCFHSWQSEQNCFVACEPRRAPTVRGISGLLWLIGCNGVTRHDAVASVVPVSLTKSFRPCGRVKIAGGFGKRSLAVQPLFRCAAFGWQTRAMRREDYELEI